MNIGILDYGVGNVGSLANMVKYIKHQPILSDKVRDLSDNKISDCGAEVLSEALSINISIVRLDLSENCISDEGENDSEVSSPLL